MSAEAMSSVVSDGDVPGMIALRTGRPDFMARSIWSELEKADDEIRAAFDAWAQNAFVPDIHEGELSLSGLASAGEGIVPEALALLARCRRDPHFASNFGRRDRIVD